MPLDTPALLALLAKADEALDGYLRFAASRCAPRTVEAAAPVVNALRANVERLRAMGEDVATTFVTGPLVHKLADALRDDPSVDREVAKQLVELSRTASSALFEAFEVVRRSGPQGEQTRLILRPYLYVAGSIFTDLDRPVATKFPELAVS